jgi:uncharacterized protein YkwD
MMNRCFFYPARVLSFAALACVCVLCSCKKEQAVKNGNIEYSMLDSVNELRSRGCKCGQDSMPPVKKLVWNNILATAAQTHAIDMYTNDYFSHISPGGISPIQRAISAGYTGEYIGENIAEGYATIGDVMLAWEKSQDHCMAMMDTLYVEMGAYSDNGYWVQEFGC